MNFVRAFALSSVIACSSVANATCNPTDVVSRMNAINATSGACKNVIDSDLPAGTICSICRSTYSALRSLRATYKADKSCFRQNPRIMAKVGALWSYRADIKRLKKLCG